MTIREKLIGAPLLALAIIFGVYPQALLQYMTPTIDKQVEDLAKWKEAQDKQATTEIAGTPTTQVSQVQR